MITVTIDKEVNDLQLVKELGWDTLTRTPDGTGFAVDTETQKTELEIALENHVPVVQKSKFEKMQETIDYLVVASLEG
jgi:hypothetical protein